MTIGSFAFTSLFASVDFMDPLLSAGFLLPVVLDMTKPFNIAKQITNIDNKLP